MRARSGVSRLATLAALALAACGDPQPAPGADYQWAEGSTAPADATAPAAVPDATGRAPSDAPSPADADPFPPAPDEPDEPFGTWERPIPVAAFPFYDARDTAEAPSPVFDAYGCALETDEGGAGYVYLLSIDAPGVLEAAIDDLPGDAVDVDLHLLSAPDPDACLIRDDVAFSFAVTPGTWYLVADTWQSDAGEVFAGPYSLSLDLVPDAAPAGIWGTPAAPIPVDGFPYSDSRDTSQASSADFDVYSCAPTTDEGGAEVVYALSLPGPGALSVAVDDLPGDAVDVDVHLLSTLDPTDCLARDDVAISHPVAAGAAYVVVDTWVDGSGAALPGPYTLTLDFAPEDPGSASGTVANPIVVDAFPFTATGNTEEAPSDAFEAYSCAPGTDESGHEVVYRLEIPEAAILRASVDDVFGDAVDVDLHVLTAPDPDACVARDDRSLSLAVEPGTLWLVVDTWVSSAGPALAGPYTLQLDLFQPPDLSQGCVVLYGDTRGAISSDPQVAHQAVVAAILDRCPTGALVHSGDLVRAGGTASDWDKFLDIEADLHAAETTFHVVRGNHDGSWAGMMNRLAPIFPDQPPNPTYTRQLTPGLTLIALDSEGDAAEQAPGLEARLSDPALADQRFVVAFHRPLYPSVGGHSGYSAGQTWWAPILKQHADRVLVLSGHNHGLSRELVDGLALVTSGGGGAPLYGCSQSHADTQYCAQAYGYTVCDPSLACLTWEVDPETGVETIGDVFSL